jgi:hypothetical protein
VPKKRVGLTVLGVAGLLIAGLSALTYNSYQKDISRARERRYTAQHIPNAHFVGYERGSHLWVGRHQEVLAEIVAFLKQQTDGNVSSQSSR